MMALRALAICASVVAAHSASLKAALVLNNTSPITSSAAAPPAGAQIAPFGKEDTAKELQSHAARTQDTLVDAVENAEVAE
eukprot:CAMPEP_0171198462 /NCGR_PEP_ID=MMETSP0790-20130122/22952_1 /TAXON_ID=2925 /ORGANISM="Alexandrium catenella, Strain OF101" /LENGTH=80 /DNA_ID=CAMNT_0011663761 /DNA_START=79 /DNA_END=318 /DNA_ORIENTATION=+